MSFIHDDYGRSFWWSIKHLIDPGFIGEDFQIDPPQPSIAHAIVGTIFTIIGLILFMFIFMQFVTTGGARLMDRVMNGSLPKDMKGHLIIIGSAD